MPKRPHGELRKASVLATAVALAVREGLEGLSLSRLAAEAGISKSGLFAHFGSKEELQLAIVDTARQSFVEAVLRPAIDAPRGLERLLRACDAFLSADQKDRPPHGAFFAAAAVEVATWTGPVHDAVATHQRSWRATLAQLAGQAQEVGELEGEIDPAQLAFELDAFLVAGTTSFALHGDPAALERARGAVRERIRRHH